MASNPATLAHLVYWDIEFNRPIVDGKIVHPITGEIQEAGRKGLTDGPPGVSMHFINMNAQGKVRTISSGHPVSVEKARVLLQCLSFEVKCKLSLFYMCSVPS